MPQYVYSWTKPGYAFHVVYLAAFSTDIRFTADADCQTDNVYVSFADANVALSAECLYHDALTLKFYTGTEIFIDIQFLHFFLC